MGHVNRLLAWKRRLQRWFWWLVGGVPAGVGALISLVWHYLGKGGAGSDPKGFACHLPLARRSSRDLRGASTIHPLADVRKEHLKKASGLRSCGGRKEVEVHHIRPFHLDRALELEPTNLITLCNHLRCHLLIGHLGSYRSWNVDVRKMAASMLRLIANRP